MKCGKCLTYCCKCGCWLAPERGRIRVNEKGALEITCDDCEKLQDHALVQFHKGDRERLR